jgi:MinD superfamily P-loop ATPase
VIINRNGIGDTAIDGYCQEVGLPILMRIPMERRTAAALARGIPLVDAHPEYLVRFRELHQQLRRWFEATTPQARTCC